MPQVGPYGLGGLVLPAVADGGVARAYAAPELTSGIDYSATNVQEQGVDEPDIVKTDGRTVFVVGGGRLRAVDVTGARPAVADTLDLPDGWSHELLLAGSRLLVVSRGYLAIEPAPLPAPGAADGASRSSFRPVGREQVRLTQVDVSDPRDLRVLARLTLDGSYLTARERDGSVRLVVQSQIPVALPFVVPASGEPAALEAATARNRAVVREARATAWLPKSTLVNARTGARRTRALVQCRNVLRPASFSGLGALTVLTIDLRKGLEPVDSDALMTDAQVAYASTSTLVVATQRWAGRPDPARPEILVSDQTVTTLHAFSIAERDRTTYRASGDVPGVLLSQWSMSEWDGVLRVASTDTPSWLSPVDRRESESWVTTLREQNGVLAVQGRVGGLGKGERIYAVRFLGDVGYVVTFRQVDPLYTIDLSDPSVPRVMGELKILGYSSYLHPVGEELLLGVGQDATEEGRIRGSQLSLFDVQDLRRPDRLAQRTIGPGSSEAEYDHHAFLYWPQTRLVVLPVQTWAVDVGAPSFGGVIAYRVGRGSGIGELGRIVHPPSEASAGATAIRRSIVVRDQLLTVSDAGLKANALESLSDRGWVPFG